MSTAAKHRGLLSLDIDRSIIAYQAALVLIAVLSSNHSCNPIPRYFWHLMLTCCSYQYNVDLYFCGHSHVYVRNDPVYLNQSDPNGLNDPRFTWYVVNGAAGHYDGLDTLQYPLMPYTQFAQDTDYSWSRLTFHNCTHLTLQSIASANGSVYDEATLFKNRTCNADSRASPWW